MHLKLSLPLFCLIAFATCQPKSSTTSISITRKNAEDIPIDSVKLSYLEFMNEEYLLEGRLDSLQQIQTPILLTKSIMGLLKIGNATVEVYLRSGDQLHVDLLTKEDEPSFIFSSTDKKNNIGHLNNYLLWLKIQYEKFDYTSIGRETAVFLASFDSLQNIIKERYRSFSDSVSLHESEISVLTKLNELHGICSKMYYTFLTHNNFLVEQIYAFRDGKDVLSYQFPTQLREVVDNLPLDTALLNSSVYNRLYQLILYDYAKEKFEIPLVRPDQWDQPKPQLPSIIQSSIKKEQYPDLLQEYLQAQNINEFMISKGLTPVIDSLHSRFSLDFPNSKYLTALEKTFDWETTVLPGEVAPNFTGTKVDGTRVSLSDFKGRVIYVDVWATWCGPCVEEIPYSIQLQREFANNQDVIFLNVSVDNDVEAWRRKIAKESSWGNVHIILTKKEARELTELYKVVGYPKYFLIDKDGKIVTAHAARPSSKETIANEIKRLINRRASM